MGARSENAGPPEAPEDDHDVLTFREAGTRLKNEIEIEREALQQLEARAAPSGEIAAALARLSALEAASARHTTSRPPMGDPSAFFGRAY